MENEIAEPVGVVIVVDLVVSGRLMHGVRCNELITRIVCARESTRPRAGISARPPESREYSTSRGIKLADELQQALSLSRLSPGSLSARKIDSHS